MTFGKEFTTAVEQKQIAQQDAERAKFVVEKAEQERQAAVIRAEGEAEAANTISAAINKAGDAFVQFRKIEASREIGQCFLITSSQRHHFVRCQAVRLIDDDSYLIITISEYQLCTSRIW